MKRYQIWDKKSDIYTLGRDENGQSHYTAEEYISKHASWAGIPGVKVIIGGGAINGTVFMEFEATVEHYRQMGANIPEGISDEEALRAIEAFEDAPQDAIPSAEERIAAALELSNLLNL